MFLTFTQTIASLGKPLPPPSAIHFNGNDTHTLEWYIWPEITEEERGQLSSLRPNEVAPLGPSSLEVFYPKYVYTFEDLAYCFQAPARLWEMIFEIAPFKRGPPRQAHLETILAQLEHLSTAAFQAIGSMYPAESRESGSTTPGQTLLYPIATEPVEPAEVIAYIRYKAESDVPFWITQDEDYIYADFKSLLATWTRLMPIAGGPVLYQQVLSLPLSRRQFTGKWHSDPRLFLTIKKEAPRGPSVPLSQGG